MSTLSNANTYIAGNQLKTADDIGREQVQPLNNDWVLMLTSDFTRNDNYSLLFAYNAKDFFQLGDRLRIRQLGVYKYFYVIDVVEDRIRVAGGDNLVSADTITEIAFSRISAPFGMGGSIEYTFGIGADVGIPSYDSAYCIFNTVGNLCTVYWSFTNISINSGAFELQFSMPFPLVRFDPDTASVVESVAQIHVPIIVQDTIGSQYFLRGKLFTDLSPSQSLLLVTPLNGAAYGVTSFDIEGISFTFPFNSA